MYPTTLLQRLRFCSDEPLSTLSPRLPEKHDPDEWLQNRRATYWKEPGKSDGFSHPAGHLPLHTGQRITSDTFFNTFFARYWQELTTLRSLGLTLRYSGRLKVEIIGYPGWTTPVLLATEELAHSDQPAETSFKLDIDLSNSPFLRIAFLVTALEDNSRLLGGHWHTFDAPQNPVRLALLTPTYNRPQFCRRTVERILGDPDLAHEDLHLWIVEQSETPELSGLANDRCHVFQQRNLGSTGGYTRALCESLYEHPELRPTHCLFMDDDIDLETDSILRAIRLYQFARQPFILGGTMIDLHNPTTIGNLGSFYKKGRLDYYVPQNHLGNSSAASAEALFKMSIPMQTHVAAWWFAVFPVSVIDGMGLPIPFFLKMDDVEYSLRATQKGTPLYVMPGIGLWHLTGTVKSCPGVDYVAFYNQLLVNTYYDAESGRSMFTLFGEMVNGALERKRMRMAVLLLRCMEDLAGGWKNFRDATFPQRWDEVTSYISRFPEPDTPEALNTPVDDSCVEKYREHFLAVCNRGLRNMETIHAEFQEKLPATTTPEAWREYFQRGNSTFLS